jgi:DNA invertase Pin-like site-specific DNA recombinase
MNPVILAQLLNTLGTVGLPLVQKLMKDIEAGRTQTTVTAEDIAELERLSKQSAADLFKKAGITAP